METEKNNNKDQWCFCYYDGLKPNDFNERAALLKSTRWIPGDKITISFLDGEESVQARVIKVAMELVDGLANLIFEFRKDTTDTAIRISFRYSGSWSVLGTTCKKIKKSQPTMNFGWLDKDTSDDELRRVVLHEFGHAIGLIHEHMTPADDGIQWNKQQVRKDLQGPPNNWSDEDIDNNMFRAFTKEELTLTNMDPTSIMMYPIPAKWTTNGFSVGLNTKLSAEDKRFIKAIYPGK